MSDYTPSESQVVWDVCTPANSSFEIPDSQDEFEEPPSTQLVPDSQQLNASPHPTQVLQLCQAHAESWDYSGLSVTNWESCQLCANHQSLADGIEVSQPDEPRTPQRSTALERDDRIRCQTLASIGWKAKQIAKHYNWTVRQVYYACQTQLTPQIQRRRPKPKLNTPRRQQLINWLQESPTNRNRR